MICATILETTTDAILSRALAVAATADRLEIRADAVPPGELDLGAVIARRPRPLVVTCRPPREGGQWTGTEEARLALLRRAAELGAEVIDVEHDAAAALGPVPAKVLVSRHDFSGELDAAAGLASLRAVAGATYQKLAVAVTDAADAVELLTLAAKEERPTIAIGLGAAGIATRLLAGKFGAPWTYAAADPTKPAAPGQLGLEPLAALLRRRRPSRATRAFGVIGRPVGHSRSPALMNAVFGALGVDAVYTWLETARPDELLAAPFSGFSVTIPHKEWAARAATHRSKAVVATGAANTLVRESDGAWVAHNTDAPAAADVLTRAALGRELALTDLAVDLLGAGGAARACAWAFREAGARVTLFDRTEARGRAVAAELGVSFGGGLEAVRASGAPRALVNATSVGMQGASPGASPVGRAALDAATIVFDLVYTPEVTPLLELATAAGALPVGGLEMFVAQARRQLELWCGKHVASRVSDDWLAARVRSGS